MKNSELTTKASQSRRRQCCKRSALAGGGEAVGLDFFDGRMAMPKVGSNRETSIYLGEFFSAWQQANHKRFDPSFHRVHKEDADALSGEVKRWEVDKTKFAANPKISSFSTAACYFAFSFFKKFRADARLSGISH